jgi:SAM-dependent methyltransferase
LSSYDNIAGLYNAFWADWYLPAAMPALESLFFSRLAKGACILDLCCGSGHITRELVARGYHVTGVDLSSALIKKAREALPAVEFLVQDARELCLHKPYEAVLSTFDSLNHILTLEDLRSVFTRVRAHLKSNGLFVFDMNSEAAYFVDLRQWTGTVNHDDVGLVRGTYDCATKTARTELLWFQKQPGTDLWAKSESIVEQRCYTQTEIMTALLESGFSKVEAVSAEDIGVHSDLGFGRIFYTARP